jgi:predicted component of viral defense system (DUF524 family)
MGFTLHRLTSRDAREDVVAIDGAFSIDAAYRHSLEGSAEVISAARRALGPAIETVLGSALVLSFGNSVGVYPVGEFGTIVVRTRKWSERHFDEMLEDVARVSAALPFSHASGGFFPFERAATSSPDLLYHAFVYLRHALKPSRERTDVRGAFESILADPHRRAARELVEVQTEHLRVVGPQTLHSIASARGHWLRVPIERIPAALRGQIPARLPEPRTHFSVDTPENRFAKASLELCLRIVDGVKRLATDEAAFGVRLEADCISMRAALEPIARHRVWKEVGPLRVLPANSTVLQRRRGYRDLFRHYQRLVTAAEHLPLSDHATRALLESKNIATLYELWCFFRVVEELTNLLGPPSDATTTEDSPFERALSRECAVVWPCGTRALYNATFRRNEVGDPASYSVNLRPDISVALPSGDIHVLDAKFRLDRIPGGDELDARGKAKHDDICKMHAYRDALPRARSAWILYPGTSVHRYVVPGGSAVDGVGALPLRPGGDDNSRLREYLGTLIASAREPNDSSRR